MPGDEAGAAGSIASINHPMEHDICPLITLRVARKAAESEYFFMMPGDASRGCRVSAGRDSRARRLERCWRD